LASHVHRLEAGALEYHPTRFVKQLGKGGSRHRLPGAVLSLDSFQVRSIEHGVLGYGVHVREAFHADDCCIGFILTEVAQIVPRSRREIFTAMFPVGCCAHVSRAASGIQPTLKRHYLPRYASVVVTLA
jgi:hypothetical protein